MVSDSLEYFFLVREVILTQIIKNSLFKMTFAKYDNEMDEGNIL